MNKQVVVITSSILSHTIETLMDLLDVRIHWGYSSSLNPEGAKNELLYVR